MSLLNIYFDTGNCVGLYFHDGIWKNFHNSYIWSRVLLVPLLGKEWFSDEKGNNFACKYVVIILRKTNALWGIIEWYHNSIIFCSYIFKYYKTKTYI